MKLITTVKRPVAVAVLAAAATCIGFAVSSQATAPCPLPTTYTTSTTSTSTDNSPGQQQGKEAVLHNGKVLCLPTSGASAHIRHGDQDLGPCNTNGASGS